MATKLNTQSHIQSLTKTCLWCVQLVSVWNTHKMICKQKISTTSTLSIIQVWKWLLPKELHHITLTSPRKHACNHAIFYFFIFLFFKFICFFFFFWSIFFFVFHFSFWSFYLFYSNTLNILLCKCYTLLSTSFIICT